MSGRASGQDVIVIGGGANGLATAAACARAGLRVTLLEARETIGGLAGVRDHAAAGLFALDPVLVRDLALTRHGLGFSRRDVTLVGLPGDGRALAISRQRQVAARAIAAWSMTDSQAWMRLQPRLFARARGLRKAWWEGEGVTPALIETLGPLAVQSAAALLDAHFETDALKAALAFDATAGGRGVSEPGSALVLLWRLAQEMSGLQAAVALPKGGMTALIAALAASAKAQGVTLRLGAAAGRVLAYAGAASGVALASGEILAAPIVLSSLSRRRTLRDLLPGNEAGLAALTALDRNAPRVASARLTIALRGALPLSLAADPSACRFILAERLESYATAHGRAQSGVLGPDLPMEAQFLPMEDGGAHILSVLIRPVPARMEGGWKRHAMRLIEIALPALARSFPGLVARIGDVAIATPEDLAHRYGYEEDAPGPGLLIAPFGARCATPLQGLMLCGAGAEPVPSISGRAGRLIAAQLAREFKR